MDEVALRRLVSLEPTKRMGLRMMKQNLFPFSLFRSTSLTVCCAVYSVNNLAFRVRAVSSAKIELFIVR